MQEINCFLRSLSLRRLLSSVYAVYFIVCKVCELVAVRVRSGGWDRTAFVPDTQALLHPHLRAAVLPAGQRHVCGVRRHHLPPVAASYSR